METRDEQTVETPSETPSAQGEEPGKANVPEGALPLDAETERLVQWDQEELPEAHERTSKKRAGVMFFVAVAFLVIVGLMAGHGISGQANQFMFGWWLGGPLLALWGVIILEAMWGLVTVEDRHINAFKRFVLVVLLPPFRAAFAVAYPGRFVWVPRHGWLRVGRLNYERMELAIAIPMLAVTLVVVPLLGIELFLADWLEQHLWAAVVVHCLTALVWFAFALEFIVMLALAEKKLAYCKLHWINIAIIVLPLIAFLRVIRIFRFLRVGKASKLLRAYRMRGVVSRTMRLAMVFNLIDRLLERNPEKYLAALEEKLREKQTEVQVLEEKMDEMRLKIAQEKAKETEAEVHAEATKPA